jgi:hypothetical protein
MRGQLPSECAVLFRAIWRRRTGTATLVRIWCDAKVVLAHNCSFGAHRVDDISWRLTNRHSQNVPVELSFWSETRTRGIVLGQFPIGIHV